MNNRVVITGIGVISPVGVDLATTWGNLIAGNSGISKLELVNKYCPDLNIKFAGQVKDFDLADYYPEKANGMRKDMDRFTQFAVAATKEAMHQSKLMDAVKNNEIKAEEIATFVGTGIGGIDTIGQDICTLIDSGPKRVGVRTIIKLMPNAAAGQIAIEYGLKGQSKSESTACASGLDAVLSAYNNIKYGLSKAVVTGGAEACVMPLALTSFNNMRALSKRDCPPEEASAPFSADRDGFVMGEGAVIFTLEEREFAINRGAHIYAEVKGGAGICDAFHITAPHENGEGAMMAMQQAMKVANVKPEEIQYIHAHGTSTPLNDHRETIAIKRAFGEEVAKKLAISSTKSMTGHMIGAAGPMGILSGCMALEDNTLPPTINYRNPDPECDLDYIPNEARKITELDNIMINALGFGGHNTSIIIGRHE